MSSKNKKNRKPDCAKRNAVATVALARSGSGKHQDKRTKRKRTRSAQKRAALKEQA